MEYKEIINDVIAQALMDGQNQIHDLKDGKATPQEVNDRMLKSVEYHTDKLVKRLATN